MENSDSKKNTILLYFDLFQNNVKNHELIVVFKSDTEMHACNPTTQENEIGRLQVKPRLHRKPCL